MRILKVARRNALTVYLKQSLCNCITLKSVREVDSRNPGAVSVRHRRFPIASLLGKRKSHCQQYLQGRAKRPLVVGLLCTVVFRWQPS
jgi:hypothetical protein